MALRQAIDQLTALGRNLNQIARVLNQGGRPALPGRQEVAAMLKVAEALRDHFRALPDDKRWSATASTTAMRSRAGRRNTPYTNWRKGG